MTAEEEERAFLEDARKLLKEMQEEEKMHKNIHKAVQQEKASRHEIHKLMYIKGKGYEAVPIPQYER